ncbi:hypothetical protein SAMN05216257_104388 [Meinhardsimonia xiamenensis]|jgi:hypothetical protein|uniref:Uncharacterized protein n=1 Tax=Meinhardsimonia xiamenensis TaxID=990712 RepID=A0A1G9ENB3_9RHOB|nr:hypothetical protein [Meinhardsimonia xiamenensis]PRX33696.1 hypothetical protein LV81_02126 [Meinhardsimonia xiamenensis]SDK77616.1 hypothetical protein SAMN05216257_104388 [Meinhardsimonia xiamenensis]
MATAVEAARPLFRKPDALAHVPVKTMAGHAGSLHVEMKQWA